MRRLLAIVLLLSSGAISAQTDERRVRTVQLDADQQRAGEPDEWRDAPPDERRDASPDERRDAPPDERVASPNERRAGAPHPADKLALARKLVDLAPDSDSAEESAADCIPQPETMRKDMAAAYRASPAQFHGISPRSVHWPEVERAWHAYYVERCAAQHAEPPAAIIARSYAAYLSTDELREVAAFQESRSGRAFIAASAKAQQDLQRALAARSEQDPEAAINTFRQALERLKAQSERAR